jgi:hypothetical protein
MTRPTARTEQSARPVDAARQQAAKVGQHAGEKPSQLAETATDQAKQVTAEAGRQARDLIGEARVQLGSQASAQQRKVADGLRSLVDELTSMAENGGQSGPATEVAHQAAERVRHAATWLHQREPGDLVGEVRRLGRQHPGTFLLGAVLAGVLVGRLTRGAVEAASSTSSDDNGAAGRTAARRSAASNDEPAPSAPPPLGEMSPSRDVSVPTPPPIDAAGLDAGPGPLGRV